MERIRARQEPLGAWISTSSLTLRPIRARPTGESGDTPPTLEISTSIRSPWSSSILNFEYHAAKNEQGLLERRITMLRDRLDRSVLLDENAATGDTISVGAKVEIEDEQGERMEVEISSVGGVSPDSPVGRALMGRKVSDEVEVQAPSGSWRARILSIGR